MICSRPFWIALLTTALSLAGCSAHAGGSPIAPTAIPEPGLAAEQRARNVILFIGDGMGVSTVTAARIYDGQSRGEPGEENRLSFEHFPHVGLVQTYNSNQQVPDSAGTATAIHSGTKTRAGMINIGPNAAIGDCRESMAHQLANLGQSSTDNNRAVGVVSTARLTHATPATVYAHAPDRAWEADSDIPETERGLGCTDMAAQLAAFPFDIALGGGAAHFFGEHGGGQRIAPDADLPGEWAARTGGQFVTTAQGLAQTRAERPVLGLFAQSHMTFMLARPDDSSEPTLTEMTAAAIRHLSNRPNGYYLMVEGGRIDHGHHVGIAALALSETQEFARAVSFAVANTDPAETLILVTADHSHVFTIAGYPTRGNPILGLVMGNDERGEPTGEPVLAADGQPYTTLGYQNGPGAITALPRPSPDTNLTARQQAVIPTQSETHGGEDVAIYATGPGAEAVHGVMEQNRIFDIIVDAMDLGRSAASSD
jgi:alkaline phosphatase